MIKHSSPIVMERLWSIPSTRGSNDGSFVIMLSTIVIVVFLSFSLPGAEGITSTDVATFSRGVTKKSEKRSPPTPHLFNHLRLHFRRPRQSARSDASPRLRRTADGGSAVVKRDADAPAMNGSFINPIDPGEVSIHGPASSSSAYSWRAGPWGDCDSSSCGDGGLQSRSLKCVHTDGEWEAHFLYCAELSRPQMKRSCFKVCDVHRQWLRWDKTHWSECELEDVADRRAQRLVDGFLGVNGDDLDAPLNCQGVQRGIQRRDVACKDQRTNRVHEDYVCSHFASKPEVTKLCVLPCPQNCVVTDFGAWSPCDCTTTYRSKTRRVVVPPLNGGKSCPPLSIVGLCPKSSECRHDLQALSYKFQVGHWGPCRSDADSEGRGTGIQMRDVFCVDIQGRSIDETLCEKFLGQAPFRLRACVIPRHCEVTQWSEWQPVNASCLHKVDDDDITVQMGHNSRHRTIRQLSMGHGESCPHLLETEQIRSVQGFLPSCPTYKWASTNWTNCLVDQRIEEAAKKDSGETIDSNNNAESINNFVCGGGRQFRTVFCVREQDDVPVDDDKCSREKPETERDCTVLCANKCIVSEWSQWSQCKPQICVEGAKKNRRGYRTRVRGVIQEPKEGVAECPRTEETQQCTYPTCYFWNATSFTKCVPDKGGTCGDGVKTRSVQCIQFLLPQEVVMDEKCHTLDEPKPNEKEPCHIPCPNDCVVSQWSAWSTCSRPCGVGRQAGRRTRRRRIIAPPNEAGKPCPREIGQEELCNEFDCRTFYWHTSAWGACKLNDPQNDGRHGMRIRDVDCYKVGGARVQRKKCDGRIQPLAKEECTIPSPRGCQLSHWSEWSSCSRTCLERQLIITDVSVKGGSADGATSDSATGVSLRNAPFQERFRAVLQEPEPDGEACPNNLREVRACLDVPKCHTYRWEVAKWSDCLLAPNEVCGLGVKMRDARCKRSDGRIVTSDSCVGIAGPLPITHIGCNVTCDNECQVSEWSEWSACSNGCSGYKERTRSIIGRRYKKDQCKKLEDSVTLIQSEICLCPIFMAHPVGEWSSCILPQKHVIALNSVEKFQTQNCGEGVKYKAVMCRDSSGWLEEPKRCSKTGFIEEKCFVPCPSDCQMTSWSSWSECSIICGLGERTRQRKLVRQAYDGGRPCPMNGTVEIQKHPCFQPCTQYDWSYGAWSDCDITNRSSVLIFAGTITCGTGNQVREVTCVEKDTMGNYIDVVNDTFCDSIRRPPAFKSCALPCPGQCVVSEWSEWSSCNDDCIFQQTRNRLREVVRQPDPTGTDPSLLLCPPLQETEDCRLGLSCFEYRWNLSSWSNCMLDDGAFCGRGKRVRFLRCLRVFDNRDMPLDYCKRMGKRPIPPEKKIKEICEVPCPSDCKLTEWSAWSDCPAPSSPCRAKNPRYAKRIRSILRRPVGKGRACPLVLEQRKACPVELCFTVVKGEWSPCEVEAGACGEGIKRREVWCQREDGQRVDFQFCSRQLAEERRREKKEIGAPDDPAGSGFASSPSSVGVTGGVIRKHKQIIEAPLETEATCHVPCPEDCQVSEWSQWSECVGQCSGGATDHSPPTQGRRVRSRAVLFHPGSPSSQLSCVSSLYETRPCDDPQCYSFEWQVGAWRSDHSRQVWCQRLSASVNAAPSLVGHHRPAAPRVGGLNVTGGCKEDEKPPSRYECGPLPGRLARAEDEKEVIGDGDKNTHLGCQVPNAVCSNGRCVCLGDFANHRNKSTGVLIACLKGKQRHHHRVADDFNQNVRDTLAVENHREDDDDVDSKNDVGDYDSRLFSWGDSSVTHLMETIHHYPPSNGVDDLLHHPLFPRPDLPPQPPDEDGFGRHHPVGDDGLLTFGGGGGGAGGERRDDTRRREIGFAPNRLWLYAVVTASCVLLVFLSIALYISWTRCRINTT